MCQIENLSKEDIEALINQAKENSENYKEEVKKNKIKLPDYKSLYLNNFLTFSQSKGAYQLGSYFNYLINTLLTQKYGIKNIYLDEISQEYEKGVLVRDVDRGGILIPLEVSSHRGYLYIDFDLWASVISSMCGGSSYKFERSAPTELENIVLNPFIKEVVALINKTFQIVDVPTITDLPAENLQRHQYFQEEPPHTKYLSYYYGKDRIMLGLLLPAQEMEKVGFKLSRIENSSLAQEWSPNQDNYVELDFDLEKIPIFNHPTPLTEILNRIHPHLASKIFNLIPMDNIKSQVLEGLSPETQVEVCKLAVSLNPATDLTIFNTLNYLQNYDFSVSSLNNNLSLEKLCDLIQNANFSTRLSIVENLGIQNPDLHEEILTRLKERGVDCE